MKNRRMLVILILLFLLTAVVVLGSAVFTVSDISVKWHTTQNYFAGVQQEEIVDSIEFKEWESVFLVNKDDYIAKLENNNPYLKVVGIEIQFPNKLVLHLAEREELFAIKVLDSADTQKNHYILVDGEMKVLSKQANVPYGDPKIVQVNTDLILSDSDFVVGEFVQNEKIFNVLTNFTYSMRRLDYNNQRLKSLAKTLLLEQSGQEKTLTIVSNFGNVTVKVLDAQTKFFEKLQYGISAYENNYQNVFNTNLQITVGADSDGDLFLDM